MSEQFWDLLRLVGRASNILLEIMVNVSHLQRFARWITGSDAIVEVPAEPRILPPAAQRALAEAEQRRRGSASFIDKYASLASR